MNSKLVFSSLLLASLLGCGYGSSPDAHFFLSRLVDEVLVPSIPGAAEAKPNAGLPQLDQVTYVLVDTSLFYLQLGKTGLGFNGFDDPMGPLFDFTWNTTRVICRNETCSNNKIDMELRDAVISGLSTIKLTTDFQPKKININLNIGNLRLFINKYRHTITEDISNITRVGEGAEFELVNADYGISADYAYFPNLGIQVSNVDLTLNIPDEKWTIQNRYLILPDGTIIEEGLYEGDIGADIMSIWKGNYEGKPLEPQYEQWAEFLINCGLSGGRSSERCSEVEDILARYKSRNIPSF